MFVIGLERRVERFGLSYYRVKYFFFGVLLRGKYGICVYVGLKC